MSGTVARLSYGAADGYGRFGILDSDESGLLVCHECGQSWRHLATHVRAAHGLLAADYRERHGLARSRALVAASVSSRMSESWERNREEHLADIESSRDPEKARLRSPVGHAGQGRGTSRAEVRAGYQQRARARRGRALTEAERALLGDGLDLQAWADAARRLLARESVTARSLAEACDIAQPTVHQRLRRYPPRTQQT